MTLYNYLLNNLENTVRIDLHIGDNIFQYIYWNWILRESTHYQKSELHLLNNDYTIGHILYDGKISENEDGSVVYYSKNHPCKLILNFYSTIGPKKPTKKQIKMIEFLEQQLSFWKNSNDIGSPTHIGDIREYSQFLSDDFTQDEIQGVDTLTHELYLNIMEIK